MQSSVTVDRAAALVSTTCNAAILNNRVKKFIGKKEGIEGTHHLGRELYIYT